MTDSRHIWAQRMTGNGSCADSMAALLHNSLTKDVTLFYVFIDERFGIFPYLYGATG